MRKTGSIRSKPGDTIWDLTEKYLIDMRYWRRLQELNNVVDPYRMPTGRLLRIPSAWLRMDPVGAVVLKTQGAPQVISGKGETAVFNARNDRENRRYYSNR